MGRQAGRQAFDTRLTARGRRRLTARAARFCMKSQRFTQRRWTAGDAAAIFNPSPSSLPLSPPGLDALFELFPLRLVPRLQKASHSPTTPCKNISQNIKTKSDQSLSEEPNQFYYFESQIEVNLK